MWLKAAIPLILLGISVALQLITSFFAIKLFRTAGRRTAGLIALTIALLMGYRRVNLLYGLVFGGLSHADPHADAIALCISFLFFIAILYIHRLISSEAKAASSLKKARQNYQTLLNQSPDGVLLIDMDGRIIEFNDTAARDLGYTREEFAKLQFSGIDPIETPAARERRIEDVLKNGTAEFEVKHRTKSGDLRDVHVFVRVLESHGKRVLHNIWRDITERKKVEEKLIYIMKAVESTSDAIGISDSLGHHFYQNKAFSDLYGYATAEELEAVGGGAATVKNPEVALEMYDNIMHGKSWAGELELVTKSGHVFPAFERADAIKDNAGNIIGLIGIITDITERKKAEEALLYFQMAVDSSTDAIGISTPEGRHYYQNEAFTRLFGLSVSEVDGLSGPPATIYADEKMGLKIFETLMQGGAFSGEVKMFDKDRNERDIYLRAYSIKSKEGKVLGLVGTHTDITDRKKAEEKLRKNEWQLIESQRVARLGSWDLDLVARKLDWSAETYQLFDKTPGEFVPSLDAFEKLVHPDDRETMQANFNNALKGDDKPYYVTARIINDSGRQWIMEASGEVRRDKDGSPISIFGTAQDVTERKKAEEALRQNEEMMRNLLDSVDEGFIVIDRDYHILSANRAYCGQVGMDPASVMGRHCYEVSHKLSRPCFENEEECAARIVFENGEPHVSVHRHPDPGGDLIYVETRAFPLKDSSGQVTSVIEVINDITEKQLLEEQRLKTQKLEAVGTLAGGIAHDFNNLLQGVFGYISMAKITHDQKQKSLDMLDQAEKALNMSVNLTNQLLTFSKGGKPVRKNIDLRPVIENSVKFALSGSRVNYRIEIDEALCMVDADEGQIGQVLQNIVLNAQQSMPSAGTVTIKANNIRAPQKGLPAELPRGTYVCISINDQGAGIPEKHLSKIFDPYFTTKEKGSGLGLATSYSIIKNHGGMIDVKSDPGQGSTFTVWLPAAETPATIAEAATVSRPAGRKCRILLMDDEELIRHIAKEMIRSLGHEVEFASNGEEAISEYRKSLLSNQKFDIVILDLTIRGGMGGEAAIKALRAIDPDIKAVVSSGYADSSAISEYRSLGFRTCLTKPYNIKTLNDTLNSLSD